jgi:SSS family solute:Na+ symporter
VIRRNAALLPAYSFLLGLIALLGFMAVAVGVDKMPAYAPGFQQFANQFSVPALFLEVFPDWFAGFAFASIGIGALVPAAIMSIAAANLFTRNIYREFIAPDCAPRTESMVAKTTSLVVKVGALIFIMTLPKEFAINLQLLGGVWIIQTFPSVIFGLYTRWLDNKALLVGWAAGMVTGTWMAASLQFRSQIFPLTIFGTTIPAYIAIWSFLLNIGIVVVLTLVFNASKRAAADETMPGDYAVESGPALGRH